jgi:hypothetical protein
MVDHEMISLRTVPLYGKRWPPAVDILVEGKRRQHTATLERENMGFFAFRTSIKQFWAV